jgi:hypothetical protein
VDKLVVAVALLMTAVFGLALGALLERGDDGSSPASIRADPTPSARPSVALPTPTASAPDRPNPDYGFARAVEERSGASFLVFDRADILVGSAAKTEAARDGAQVDPDGGYYVRNKNKRERRLRIGDDAQIRGGPPLDGHGGSMSADELATALDDAGKPVPVLLTYDDEGRIETLAVTTLP